MLKHQKKKTMRPESTLEKYFKEQAAKNKILQYKFLSGITGIPDRIIIGYGITAFVELKAKNGMLSKRQKYVIKSMRNHGAIVFVPFSKEDIDEIFKKIKQRKVSY